MRVRSARVCRKLYEESLAQEWWEKARGGGLGKTATGNEESVVEDCEIVDFIMMGEGGAEAEVAFIFPCVYSNVNIPT